MLIPIGTIVLHPLYPQWGEGIVIGHRDQANQIRFEGRAGSPGHWVAENLMDQDGHRFTHPQHTEGQVSSRRSQHAAERAAAKIQKDQEEKVALEESLRDAVTYLTSIIDQVTIGQAYARTQEQADEFIQHVGARGIHDITVLVDDRYWGVRCCIRFPVLIDNLPPFPVIETGKIGFRGPMQKRKPQARLDGGCLQLCNTEVTLRLIEKGLRYKSI
jgi:hypothetical protein